MGDVKVRNVWDQKYNSYEKERKKERKIEFC